MSSKNVQDYLDNALYGAPEIKPDEKKKYLGTFRERVVFIMTLSEAEQIAYQSFYQEKFKEYPSGTLLINANSPLTIQNRLMQQAQQAHINFRMVDTDIKQLKTEDIVIVFAVETAINLEDISVKITNQQNKKEDSNKQEADSKKSGFFKRLFQ